MAQNHTPGTRDTTYDLISVIYHALQGADTYHTYVRDANTGGDGELAAFFHDAQQQHQELAARAKDLLGRRIGKGAGRS